MKKLNEIFLQLLMEKINNIIPCYYEEAPKNANFLFGIVPTLTLNPIDEGGYSCVFDIELYNNELSDKSIENICDVLRDSLSNYSYMTDTIGFHIGFDNQILTKQSEQDLVYRRLTFTARIF